MSAFTIKLIAMLLMLADHIAYVASEVIPGSLPVILMRAAGRVAFPIFAFFIVNGFYHSSDRYRYLTRLCAFAAISQLPFSLAFSFTNYTPAAYPGSALGLGCEPALILPLLFGLSAIYFVREDSRKRLFFAAAAACLLYVFTLRLGGITLLTPPLNVYYTLALSLAVLMLLEACREKPRGERLRRLGFLALGFLCFALVILPRSDYGFNGLALVVLLYSCGRSRALQVLALGIWCCMMYAPSLPMLAGALCACPLLLLYSGRPGRRGGLSFYLFYPAHLVIIFIVFFLIR